MPQKNIYKTFSYGGERKKKDLWDIVEEEGNISQTKVPRNRGIWAKVSKSPFKAPHSSNRKNKSIIRREDPFGFNESNASSMNQVKTDPYEFEDFDEKSNQRSGNFYNSSKDKSNVVPLSPKSPTKSPSRVHGKMFPTQRKTITVDDLKYQSKPKKRKKLVVKQNSDFEFGDNVIPIVENDKDKDKSLSKNNGVSKLNVTSEASNKSVPIKNVGTDACVKTSENTINKTVKKQILTYQKQLEKATELNNASLQSSSSDIDFKTNEVKNGKESGLSMDVSFDESNNSTETKLVGQEIIKTEIGPERNDSKSNKLASGNKESAKLKTNSLFSYYTKPFKSKKSNKGIFLDANKPRILGDSDSEEQSFSDKTKYMGSNSGSQASTSSVEDSRKRANLQEMSNTGIFSDIKEKSTSTSKVEVKSPFKTLKPNYRTQKEASNLRRFSALPTCGDGTALSDDDIEEEKDEIEEPVLQPLYCSSIFGVQFSQGTAKRVKKTEKELFKVVRNTKRAHECLDMGESQQFQDDLDYLLDGLKPSHDDSTRCLSALELASKCLSPNFRMHVKAHGLIETIFTSLQDALSNERLALCTSAILYVLVNDKMSIDFDNKVIEFILKLITRTVSRDNKIKEYQKLLNKIKKSFGKQNFVDLDLKSLDATTLARETLLSLTSKQTGEWFKEEIRLLGGLDHIIDTVYKCSTDIAGKVNTHVNFRAVERCLILISDILSGNKKNDHYVLSYRKGLYVETCVRILTVVTCKYDTADDITTVVEACLLVLLQNLAHLSHENESGSKQICQHEDAIPAILKCALYLPRFMKRHGDFIVMSLGVLINLVVHHIPCIYAVSAAMLPQITEENSETEEFVSSVDALMALFLERQENCKEGDLMEELDRIENEDNEEKKHLHYHDDEDALVCGDRFDDTMAPENEPSNNQNELSQESNNEMPADSLNGRGLTENEKKDIKYVLKKAHQNMIDSHVAAYTALLLGLLAEHNQDNRECIRSLLPNCNFAIMQESLEKILVFVKATGITNDTGFKVIERIINFFKSCACAADEITE